MLRCSERVSKKTVRYGIDEFTNVATHELILQLKLKSQVPLSVLLMENTPRSGNQLQI